MSSTPPLRRFTRNDWMGFAGAEALPSGQPMIGDAKLLPPDGSSSPDVEGVVVVSGSDDGIDVGIHGVVEDTPMMVAGDVCEPGSAWYLTWSFPCERDALAFAELLVSGRMSLQALEALGGKGGVC